MLRAGDGRERLGYRYPIPTRLKPYRPHNASGDEKDVPEYQTIESIAVHIAIASNVPASRIERAHRQTSFAAPHDAVPRAMCGVSMLMCGRAICRRPPSGTNAGPSGLTSLSFDL
jgi:hypothetical protein